MKKKHRIIFGILGVALLISCKNHNNTELKRKRDKAVDRNLLESKIAAVDLLKFQVKQEIIEKDSLQLIFKNIYFYPLSKNEYKVQIKADYDHKALNYYTDYYIIIAIYPKDDEIHLLDSERRKYNFESFSVKIKKDCNDELVISRKIKTKINLARAVTISLMAYETKQKSMEVVLMDVYFLN